LKNVTSGAPSAGKFHYRYMIAPRYRQEGAGSQAIHGQMIFGYERRARPPGESDQIELNMRASGRFAARGTGFPIDRGSLLCSMRLWGDSGLPMRRHAQESRPFFRQGRRVSALNPASLLEPVFSTLGRDAVIVSFMLMSCLWVTLSSDAQPLSIDLSHLEIDAPPPEFVLSHRGRVDRFDYRTLATGPFRTTRLARSVRRLTARALPTLHDRQETR
jgi:hypothetical protein